VRIATVAYRSPSNVIDVGAQHVRTRITGEDQFGVSGRELAPCRRGARLEEHRRALVDMVNADNTNG
jgi:hypothetical protein